MLLRTGFPSPWHAYSHQTSVHGGYRPCFVQVPHFRPAECSSQLTVFFFCFLDAFAKLGKRLLVPSGLFVSMSVRPLISLYVCLSVLMEQLTLTGRVLIIFDIENFSKTCWEYSSFFEIWQQSPVIYIKTDSIYLWLHLTQFFLEWEIFRREIVRKIKTHVLCSKSFFSKILLLMK
jgi:hypothetical protein